MEKKSIKVIVFAFLFILVLGAFLMMLFLYRAVSSRVPEVAKMEVQQADEQTALVSFLTGEAFVFRGEKWSAISIGDVLKGNDRVKVVDNSYCELQIGQIGIVAVEANTVVELDSIYSAAGEGDVDMEVISGMLLCKVNKLTGNEAFEVKVQSTVIGVRGTGFLVSSYADAVQVAVSDGTVDFSAIDDSFETIIVSENTEVVFNPVEKRPGEAQNISEGNAAALEKVEAKPFLPLEAKALAPVLIQTVPPDAAVMIDGVPVGAGRVFGVYPDGARLDIRAYKNGYLDEEAQIELDAEKQNIVTLTLTVDDSVELEQKEEPDIEPETHELEEEIEALSRELDAAESVRSELEERIESLNEQVGALESDKAALRAEVSSKEEEISRIKEALRTLTED